MKKLILASMALAVSLTVMAEGYQVNTLSARQGGMAHTGISTLPEWRSWISRST
ncbi:hypothetical protein [uncultured Muribaculum sp.]|uniref:hypothetical protein n=1 Tax=uncultured Muribaculum sp. TaxID=1918613 RepID=UPI0025B79482|nr:hypothetical protein [uncultured Muribaculum sp.]